MECRKQTHLTNRGDSIGICAVLQQRFDGCDFSLLCSLVQRCVAQLHRHRLPVISRPTVSAAEQYLFIYLFIQFINHFNASCSKLLLFGAILV